MVNPQVYQEVARILSEMEIHDIFVKDYFGMDFAPQKKQIINEAVLFLQKLQANLENSMSAFPIENSDNALMILEFAGNGDSIHTNLLIHHLLEQKLHPEHSRKYDLPKIGEHIPEDSVTINKNTCIYWVCNPLVEGLYKDETRFKTISNGINEDNKFRVPCGFTLGFYHLISDMIRHLFPHVLNKIFMSERICASHLYLSPLKSSQSMAFCDHYYQTTGVERNPSIKHSIEHNDSTQFFKKLPKSKYIVVEHSASYTKHNEETLEFYSSIVSFLKREKQYEIALIGGPKDPMVDGCLNYLGESLYDTYTLIKHSDGFISCNSGNWF